MLIFEDYAQFHRSPYSPLHVERKFYEIQKRLSPCEGDQILFVSVKTMSNLSDWYSVNNACNAFDFKIRKKLWKRKGRYIRPCISSIEHDKHNMRYHFHSLIHLHDLDLTTEDCIMITGEIASQIREVNQSDPTSIRVDSFEFSSAKTDYGVALHYMVKSANAFHDPLKTKVYSSKEQERYGAI